MPNLFGVALNIIFMKRLKKLFRLAGVVVLIALALCGIGIIGGAPVPPVRRKEHAIEITTEMKETRENEKDLMLFENKT